MRTDDLFIEENELDVFGFPSTPTRKLDTASLDRVRRGAGSEHTDGEIAVALARLAHDDLERYGTDSSHELDEREIGAVLDALRSVVARLGIANFDVPFRDFAGFRIWWRRNGGHGSWQARRDLLGDMFDPLHDQLAQIEQRELASSLVDPITPHARTGWGAVDEEISELRRHFLNARTPQDYRGVGLDSVAVTEALSRQVYDPALHLRDGEDEPPVSNTKQRLERFIETAASGPRNDALRRLARSSIEFAQHVKHSTTPSRRDAGIAADAVIQLANMLRRLDAENEVESSTR